MKQLFLSFLLLTGLTAAAQTPDEIVQQYSKAMGGLDAFKAVKTAKMTGTVNVQGMDLPLTIQVINGRAYLLQVEVMGQAVVNSYKDGKGWKLNPFGGAETPTDADPAELQDFKISSSLSNPLMNYQSEGHTLTAGGTGEVDGKKCNIILLNHKETGKTIQYFIGAADGLLYKTISVRDGGGQEVSIETEFADYKTVNGLLFAMTRRQQSPMGTQTISLTEVLLNVDIDEKQFDK